LDGKDGKEWNFVYVLLQPPVELTCIVVPISLQMGSVELPPYVCAAKETSRDVAAQHCNTAVETLHPHKFDNYVIGDVNLDNLLKDADIHHPMRYLIEEYIDDFMALVIPTRDRKKLNSGVRVRCIIKSTESVKFKVNHISKNQELVKFKVSHFSKNQDLVKFKVSHFSKNKS
jgi:hypothetical protein